MSALEEYDLVHREDPDVTKAMELLFRDEEIAAATETRVSRVERKSGQSVRLTTDRGAIEGTHLLVAGGRTPNTDGIGLVAQVAMAAGLLYTALRDMILTHPTMAERIGALFAAVPPEGS